MYWIWRIINVFRRRSRILSLKLLMNMILIDDENYLYIMLIINLLILQYYRSKISEYCNIQQSQMFLKHQYHTRQETRFLFSIHTIITIRTTTTRMNNNILINSSWLTRMMNHEYDQWTRNIIYNHFYSLFVRVNYRHIISFLSRRQRNAFRNIAIKSWNVVRINLKKLRMNYTRVHTRLDVLVIQKLNAIEITSCWWNLFYD